MQAKSILVIRSDDSRAHLYRDISEVLANPPVGTAEQPGGVEFFSTTGRRLAPVFDREWRLQSLEPTDDRPQPEHVLRRLRATVRQMKDYLRENGALVEKAGLTVEDGLRRLPSLPEASLDAALEVWQPVLGHETNTHTADPWHNFWVHGIL